MNSKANMGFSNKGILVALMKHKETFIKTFIDKPPFILKYLLQSPMSSRFYSNQTTHILW